MPASATTIHSKSTLAKKTEKLKRDFKVTHQAPFSVVACFAFGVRVFLFSGRTDVRTYERKDTMCENNDHLFGLVGQKLKKECERIWIQFNHHRLTINNYVTKIWNTFGVTKKLSFLILFLTQEMRAAPDSKRKLPPSWNSFFSANIL